MKFVFDEAKQREVCAIISVGGTRDVAARQIGCCERTIRNHARKNADFAKMLREAEANPQITLLKSMYEIAVQEKDLQAIKWLLERLYADKFGRRKPNTVTISEMKYMAAEIGDEVCNFIHDPKDLARFYMRLEKLVADHNKDDSDDESVSPPGWIKEILGEWHEHDREDRDEASLTQSQQP
jgi:hypothetical protein